MSNEIVNRNNSVPAIGSDVGASWSTFTNDDIETRKLAYNAISNPEKISEHLDETINLKDIVIQNIEVTNSETGEVSVVPQVILVDDKGTAYSAVSAGAYSSVMRLLSIFGHPSQWADALPVQVVERRSNRGFKFYAIAAV